jgi:hypothetical protein
MLRENTNAFRVKEKNKNLNSFQINPNVLPIVDKDVLNNLLFYLKLGVLKVMKNEKTFIFFENYALFDNISFKPIKVNSFKKIRVYIYKNITYIKVPYRSLGFLVNQAINLFDLFQVDYLLSGFVSLAIDMIPMSDQPQGNNTTVIEPKDIKLGYASRPVGVYGKHKSGELFSKQENALRRKMEVGNSKKNKNRKKSDSTFRRRSRKDFRRHEKRCPRDFRYERRHCSRNIWFILR